MIDLAKIGIILLAAGASKRLGQPKQLINFQGSNLLQTSMDRAAGLNTHPKILVLGSNAQRILNQIDSADFTICINDQWEEGMGRSLAWGMGKILEEEPQLDAVVIMVADQPFISEKLLSELIETYTAPSSIVACHYGDVIGVPVLFGKDYFTELRQLSGDQGARKIAQKHSEFLKIVRFDRGNFDIDTPEDLDQLKKLE